MRSARDFPTREELAVFDYKRSLKSRPTKEGKSRKELETERCRLESELEEEKKNRKDEEIVRGLTTRYGSLSYRKLIRCFSKRSV